MKNLGRKSINLSLDLVAIATGVLSIFNFFKKKTSNVKKDNICDGTGMVSKLSGNGTDNQAGVEPIMVDLRPVGRRRGACYCGQPQCAKSADDDTDGRDNGNNKDSGCIPDEQNAR